MINRRLHSITLLRQKQRFFAITFAVASASLFVLPLHAEYIGKPLTPVSAGYLQEALPRHCLVYGTPLPVSFGPLCFLDQEYATMQLDFGSLTYRWHVKENGLFLHEVGENKELGDLMQTIWFYKDGDGLLHTSNPKLGTQSLEVKLVVFQR